MSETILITGSEGFIGRALTTRLRSEGNLVIPFSKSLGNDLMAKSPFQDFKHHDIRIVFHLAAFPSVPMSWENPIACYEINTLATGKVAEFCRQIGACLIYLSTYVYGPPHYLPVDESHPVSPNNPYAHSKWMGEEICRFYANLFDMKMTILRPFNVFGPGQSESFLIPSIVGQWVRKKEVIVQSLTPKRDFLFVEDFIEACVVASRQASVGNVYNVGSGSSLSVNEVINCLEVIVGEKIIRKSLNQERPGEIADLISQSRLVEEGLWRPVTSFRKGLSQVVTEALGKR